MLSILRKYSSSRGAQLLLGLLVASFALWGISDIFRGFSREGIAWVGDTEITRNEFAIRYQRELRAQQLQFGGAITPELALRIGLPQQVMAQMLGNATLDENARRFGLGLSDDGLRAWLATIPDFLDAAGRFDRGRFQLAAQNNGFTEHGLLEELRAERIRNQVVSTVGGDLAPPEAYRRAIQEYFGEERDIDYLTLTAAQVGTVADPAEDALAAFFEENRALWRAPEYRSFDVLDVSATELARSEEVTEDDARQYYETHLSAYTDPEQRRIRQVLFPDQATAEAAAAALASGQTFDELIASRNLAAADVDLGLMTRAAMVDPVVAEAAFALAVGQASPVVAGRFGPVIVQVQEIVPAQVEPFEQVRAEIVQAIGTQRASARMAEIENEVTDALAGGQTLAEIAAGLGLQVQSFAKVDRQGNDQAGEAVADIPSDSLVGEVFESDVDIQNDPIRRPDSGWIWFMVTGVEPARDRTLDEVRAEVVEAWKRDQAQQRLAKTAEDLAARVRAGTPLADIAGELGLTVQTAEKLSRQGAPPQGIAAAVVAAAFGGPEGSVAVTQDGVSRILLRVSAARVPLYFAGSPLTAEAETQLGTQIGNDMLQQYINELRVNQYGFSIDQPALNQIVSAAQS